MSEQAAVARQAVEAATPRRGVMRQVLPVATLVLIDIVASILAFAFAYKLRQQADIFVWRPRKSFFPVGVQD